MPVGTIFRLHITACDPESVGQTLSPLKIIRDVNDVAPRHVAERPGAADLNKYRPIWILPKRHPCFKEHVWPRLRIQLCFVRWIAGFHVTASQTRNIIA